MEKNEAFNLVNRINSKELPVRFTQILLPRNIPIIVFVSPPGDIDGCNCEERSQENNNIGEQRLES